MTKYRLVIHYEQSSSPLAARAFEAAARHGSFVRAATELNLTPAGVSQHVRTLETWLNVPLFVRHARGVTLTAVGREFGAAVTHSLTHIEAVAGSSHNCRDSEQLFRTFGSTFFMRSRRGRRKLQTPIS